MRLGDVLYESGIAMTQVYFPTTSIISLVYVLEDGASAEIAIVGNEGIVGVSLFMGGETTPSSAVVQSAGLGTSSPARGHITVLDGTVARVTCVRCRTDEPSCCGQATTWESDSEGHHDANDTNRAPGACCE